MEKIVKTFYVAFDGREFDDENACLNYEKLNKEKEGLLIAAKRIGEICTGRDDCVDCVFENNISCPFLEKRFPCDWEF